MTAAEFKGKWIQFKEIPSGSAITKRFLVENKETGHCLGFIKWYGAFRQYSYFSHPNIVYEQKCLTDISTFLKLLMDEHKQKKLASKEQQTA